MKNIKTYEGFFNFLKKKPKAEIPDTEEEIAIKDLISEIKETFDINKLEFIADEGESNFVDNNLFIYDNGDEKLEVEQIMSFGELTYMDPGELVIDYFITVNNVDYKVKKSIGEDIYEFFKNELSEKSRRELEEEKEERMNRKEKFMNKRFHKKENYRKS
jgi:hypothetical protein